jgi:hypothetical protein
MMLAFTDSGCIAEILRARWRQQRRIRITKLEPKWLRNVQNTGMSVIESMLGAIVSDLREAGLYANRPTIHGRDKCRCANKSDIDAIMYPFFCFIFSNNDATSKW